MIQFKHYFLEETKVQEDILKYIYIFNKSKYKNVLGGGNCGMFSYALVKFLNEKQKNIVKIGLCCNSGEEKNIITGQIDKPEYETLQEINDGEPDIYHMFIDNNNKFYDETGKINVKYLHKLSVDQYNDYNALIATDLDIKNELVLSIIRNHTNWNISWEEFYSYLNNFKG